MRESRVEIPAGEIVLDGELAIPPRAECVVAVADSGRVGRALARAFNEAAMATLLIALRASRERSEATRLTRRLLAVTDWLRSEPSTAALAIGYCASDLAAAAALSSAAERPNEVAAIVSRAGRPDLAADSIPRIRAPTLLLAGDEDEPILALNQAALEGLHCEKALRIIPGATHLAEAATALPEIARMATVWFRRYLVIAGIERWL